MDPKKKKIQKKMTVSSRCDVIEVRTCIKNSELS